MVFTPEEEQLMQDLLVKSAKAYNNAVAHLQVKTVESVQTASFWFRLQSSLNNQISEMILTRLNILDLEAGELTKTDEVDSIKELDCQTTEEVNTSVESIEANELSIDATLDEASNLPTNS